jgi:predicted small lipoprotein YifL
MRICWAQTLFIILVICLGVGNMLTACGQKGALYLPETQSATAAKGSAAQEDNSKEKPAEKQ